MRLLSEYSWVTDDDYPSFITDVPIEPDDDFPEIYVLGRRHPDTRELYASLILEGRPVDYAFQHPSIEVITGPEAEKLLAEATDDCPLPRIPAKGWQPNYWWRARQHKKSNQ